MGVMSDGGMASGVGAAACTRATLLIVFGGEGGVPVVSYVDG